MLSIILPSFKEKENLKILLPKIINEIGDSDYEIIVVDDNSNDGTRDLVTSMSKNNPQIQILERPGKLGLTSAIVDGVQIAKGDCVLIMDADLSHPPEKISEFVKAIEKNELVVGSRLISGGGVVNWPIHRKLLSQIGTVLARLLFNFKCTDPMSGFFAIKKELFLKTKFRTKGYKILLNILVENPKIKIHEVPYIFQDRIAGVTKLGAGEGLTYLLDLVRLRLNFR